MADIISQLQTIKTAVYGKDMRQAIHDAIEDLGEDVSLHGIDLNRISGELEVLSENVSRNEETLSHIGEPLAKTIELSQNIRYDINTNEGTITVSQTGTGDPIIFCKDTFSFLSNFMSDGAENCSYDENKTYCEYNYGAKIDAYSGSSATWAFVADPVGRCFALRRLQSAFDTSSNADRTKSSDLVVCVLHLLKSSHKIYVDNKFVYSNNVFIDGMLESNIKTAPILGMEDKWFCLKSNPYSNDPTSTYQPIMKIMPVTPNTHYRFLVSDIQHITILTTVCLFTNFDQSDSTTYKTLDKTTITSNGSGFWIDVTTPATAANLRFNAVFESGERYGSFTLTQFSSQRYTIDNRIKAVEGKNKSTCKIFKKVVCCGDSYTSGYMDIRANSDERKTAYNFANAANDYSWVHFMSTLTGNNWINCGVSGANVLTWRGLYDEYNASRTSGAVIGHENPSLADTSGYHAAQQAGQTQAYILGLLINDSTPRKTDDGIEVPTPHHVDLGTNSDIGAEYPTTFHGGLSKIIRDLHSISPKAKIFVNTCPKNDSSDRQYSLYNQAVRHVVNYYKNNYAYPVHCIDLANHSDLYSNSSLTGDYINGHYTAIGYEQFAEIYALLLSDYINTHISEFQDVAFIPITNGNGA